MIHPTRGIGMDRTQATALTIVLATLAFAAFQEILHLGKAVHYGSIAALTAASWYGAAIFFSYALRK